MRRSKFTKGPWCIIEDDISVSDLCITSQQRLVNKKAEICGIDVNFDGVHGDAQMANAYLISSAPEMYEEIEHEHAALLWEIQNFIVEDEEDEEKLHKLQVVADRKAKILAKARGEDV